MGVRATATCVVQVTRGVQAKPSHAETQISIFLDVTRASITICTNSSIMHFTLDYDKMTESVMESVERTGEIRFTEVLWQDGYALDMILQAVDDEGSEMVDSPVRSVTDLDSIFTLALDKQKEQKIRVSFVLTGTEVVVTLSEVYLTVLDIDCFYQDVACETIYTEDHDTYKSGSKVKVEESGGGIKAYVSEHVDGANNPNGTSLTEDQENYALTLGFFEKESFTLQLTIGSINQTFRNVMLAGITNQWWEEDTITEFGSPNETLSNCSEVPKCYPISCGVPAATATCRTPLRRLLFCTMKWPTGHARLDIQ